MRGNRFWAGVWTSAGLHLSDVEGGEHRTVPIGPDRELYVRAALTRHGLRVAAQVRDRAIEVLDEAGQVLCRVSEPVNTFPSAMALSPDGTRLACAWNDRERTVAVFDATSGKQTAICKGHRDPIWTLAFSRDGSRLASGSGDLTARVWDAATGALLATCRGHTSTVRGVAFSHDGSRLVTASTDGTVRQWDAETGREVEPPYDRHANEVYSVAYSPDGQLVASAGADRIVRVWQAKGRQDVAVLLGHTGAVVEVAFAPDGRRLASLSCHSAGVFAGDDTVRVWEVDPRATLPVLRGHTDDIYPVAYSPDGRWIASGSWDKTVRLWDAATGEPCLTLPHPSFAWGLAFGPDGTWLVTGCPQDDRLRIWDVATARILKKIPFSGDGYLSLTVSPDGTRLAARSFCPKSKEHTLTVCDIASGEPLFSTGGSSLFSTDGWALAYSPNGRWLAAVAADGKTLLLLDARTHETVARFSGHEKTVLKLTFSPDSRCLASCGRDRVVRLWQIDTGACKLLNGHTDEVYAVAFHPDGTRLATAGRDGDVWLWDLTRGAAVLRLPRHKSFVWSLAFSPDGATLASGSGDNTIHLWDTAPLRTRYQARREAEALRPQAERLVEQLWREKNDPAEVVEALRADQMLSEALRQAALRAVMRQAQPPQAAPDKPHDPP